MIGIFKSEIARRRAMKSCDWQNNGYLVEKAQAFLVEPLKATADCQARIPKPIGLVARRAQAKGATVAVKAKNSAHGIKRIPAVGTISKLMKGPNGAATPKARTVAGKVPIVAARDAINACFKGLLLPQIF